MLYLNRCCADGGVHLLDDGFTFDLTAAAWRHSMADEKAFVGALATRLEKALPQMTQVEREHKLFSDEHPVREIRVSFETTEYRLSFDKRHGIVTEKAKVVRGIRLKTDAVEFVEWLSQLSAELTEYARQHEHLREDLEKFLMS